KATEWKNFLELNQYEADSVERIDFTQDNPVVFDSEGRKFTIDFVNDRINYHKKKQSLKNEILSKAVGGGRYGMKVLDLSAGLAIDAVFLAQLGYEVEAVERNPMIYLCLQNALEALKAEDAELASRLKFRFASARQFMTQIPDSEVFEVVYFDPMFPQKTKSALPRQEMVFFKNLVGSDDDAAEVAATVLQLKNVKRLAVKRPLSAPPLLKPNGQIAGKLIRYDIYGVNS
ncbi:MAG: class I SAM-dependent methyltransferase, partial [Bdellovibrionaceae bacterium]|nr:class I SAM-dependent methyltransferase [Pseudobdellovibrionaceae bacterium]